MPSVSANAVVNNPELLCIDFTTEINPVDQRVYPLFLRVAARQARRASCLLGNKQKAKRKNITSPGLEPDVY